MKYMLDTNICIYLMKNKDKKIINKFHNKDPKQLCISNITYSELMYGVEKSERREYNFSKLLLFLSDMNILNYDFNACEEYGAIRAELEREGNTIGANDMLIAAHAKSQDMILVTNNTKEFNRVKGLRVEDWLN